MPYQTLVYTVKLKYQLWYKTEEIYKVEMLFFGALSNCQTSRQANQQHKTPVCTTVYSYLAAICDCCTIWTLICFPPRTRRFSTLRNAQHLSALGVPMAGSAAKTMDSSASEGSASRVVYQHPRVRSASRVVHQHPRVQRPGWFISTRGFAQQQHNIHHLVSRSSKTLLSL